MAVVQPLDSPSGGGSRKALLHELERYRELQTQALEQKVARCGALPEASGQLLCAEAAQLVQVLLPGPASTHGVLGV